MPDIDVTGYDDPTTPGTDEGTTLVNGMIVSHPSGGLVSGTGGYTPFLNQNDHSGSSQGFNTDDSDATAPNNDAGLDMQASWTQSLRLGDIPIIIIDNVAYYEIRLDLNEENNKGNDSGGDPNVELELSELQVYWSDQMATLADYNEAGYETQAFGAGFNLAFDLDSGGVDRSLILIDGASGSGRDDYAFYIPVSAFAGASPDDYFTLFAQFGPQPQEGATFEEFRVQNVEQIDGVKFADINGDGEQDLDGADDIAGNDDDEIGLAGFTMYIDENDNNILDPWEMTAVSGADGTFTFYSLVAGTYVVREDLTGPQQLGYILTTGDGGDHVVTITTAGDYTVSVGNMPMNPDLTIVKTVLDVDGNTTDPVADAAGDIINYRIAVTNDGNMTLTGLVVTDTLDASVTAVDADANTFNDGDTNENGVFDVGETWLFDASYVVQQSDIDANGNYDGPDLGTDNDGVIRNVAAADTTQTEPENDDAIVPVVQDPSIDIEKLVSVDSTDGTDGTFVDADLPEIGPENVNIGDPVWFQVTVTNDGNMSLSDLVITDVNTSNGGNTSVVVLNGTTLMAGATLTGDDDDGNAGNGLVADGILQVGETWTITYSQAFDAGQHVNTADVDTSQGATDTDAAHYFSLIDTEGPGVRTPGFWKNLGFKFWDGIDDNQPKQEGNPGFPSGDILDDVYITDTNEDGFVDDQDEAVAGLLIGDYNGNGYTDGDEDTFFISLTDAQTLINASNNMMNDGVMKIGRDVVATWLNYLNGNGIGGASDLESPRHFIDDAIDWLQMFGDGAAGTGDQNETFDIYSSLHSKVKTGTSAWVSDLPGGDHSAAEIHAALDYYNNTGMTSPSSLAYAHDADSEEFLLALAAVTERSSFEPSAELASATGPAGGGGLQTFQAPSPTITVASLPADQLFDDGIGFVSLEIGRVHTVCDYF